MYRTVLVEMPIGPYFAAYFGQEVKDKQPSAQIQAVYNEVEINIITDTIKKFWLEVGRVFCGCNVV